MKGHECWVGFLGDFSGGLGDLDIDVSPLQALGTFVESSLLLAAGFTGLKSDWLGAVRLTGSLGVTGASLAVFGEDVLLGDGVSLVGLDGGLEGPSDHLNGSSIDFFGLNNWEVGELGESLQIGRAHV